MHVSLRGHCFFHCLTLPHVVLYPQVFCTPYHAVLYSIILHHITSCIPHHITLYHITLCHTISYCAEVFIIPCVIYPISLHAASLCCKNEILSLTREGVYLKRDRLGGRHVFTFVEGVTDCLDGSHTPARGIESGMFG